MIIVDFYQTEIENGSIAEKALDKVGLEYSYFTNKITDDENYLVFGSFYVVEEFLKRFNVPK